MKDPFEGFADTGCVCGGGCAVAPSAALTSEELRALKSLGEGLDVVSPCLARILTRLAEMHPEWVMRLPAKADEHGCRPFFHAKLTRQGRRLVDGGVL